MLKLTKEAYGQTEPNHRKTFYDFIKALLSKTYLSTYEQDEPGL